MGVISLTQTWNVSLMVLSQNGAQSICFIHFCFIWGLLVLVQPNAHVQKVIILVAFHLKWRMSRCLQELVRFGYKMTLLKYKACCCLLSRILNNLNLTLIIFTLKGWWSLNAILTTVWIKSFPEPGLLHIRVLPLLTWHIFFIIYYLVEFFYVWFVLDCLQVCSF